MSHDEIFVGSLAILLAIVAVAAAIGPWEQPYQLRSFSAITDRFGKPVARGVWVAVAVALLTAGAAILSGLRPGYTSPANSSASYGRIR